MLGREVFLTGIPVFSSKPKALPHIRKSRTVLDSGFHAVDSGFQGTRFQYLLVELGFCIPIVVRGILDSLRVFRIPQVKISQIPQSGFLYTGGKSNISNSNSIWKVSQVSWRPGL